MCAGVLVQVQKVSRQTAVFSRLAPGRLYHFAVRTEKESFTDSSAVAFNITAGEPAHGRSHTLLRISSNLYILTAACNSFFIISAPSAAEVSLVNKTTTSICVSWRMIKGIVSGLILSIRNKTCNQELIVSGGEPG